MSWREHVNARLIFGILVWVALSVALASSWDDIKADLARAGLLFPVTVVLVAAGLVAAARGWSVIQSGEPGRKSMMAFLASQPAKYIPAGGAFQALGQVGLSSGAESPRSDTGWAFLVHAVVQVAAAAIVALALLAAEPNPWISIAVVGFAVFCAAILRQSVAGRVIDVIVRAIPRLKRAGRLPPTSDLWRSLGWTIIAPILSGIGFVILLGTGDELGLTLGILGVFSVAWIVGFLVFPVPSGLGIRELTLVALLPGYQPAQVLGVSVLHRFATIVAELVLLTLISKFAFLRSKGVDNA